MFHIIYMSTAAVPFSPDELKALLEVSRRNNAALGITGLLLYKDEHFLQVIEGEKTVVEKLFARISCDHRHTHILELFREETPARDFPDWSMAFRDLTLGAEGYPEGFNDLLNANWADRSLFPPKVRAFMKMFVN
jgi:hypothetical protein